MRCASPVIAPVSVRHSISKGDGTHWVAYYKDGTDTMHFDSYGLDPPFEIVNYYGCPVRTQAFQLQATDDVICGQLCLYVLKRPEQNVKI